MAGPRPFHVMAKPVGARCNIACSYCYYLEKDELFPARKPMMERAVLERFVADYIASQSAAGLREIWFSWQGGEPTLLGLRRFREIIEVQARHCPPGHRIRNALQTNGTLIDADWARFLAEEQVLVGVSLDGPPALHDRCRIDRRGLGSASRVLAGLDLLKTAGAEVNLLCTVNRENARHPLEVYRFLRERADFLQFIPVVERLLPDGRLAAPRQGDGATLAPFSVKPRDYGRFLCAVFDDWLRNDVGRIHVQTFDVQFGIWLGRPSSLCIHAETCGDAVALEHSGDLYACDHFVYPEHRLGNLSEAPLADLVRSPRQEAFGRAKADLPAACRACRWRRNCGGGCPKHRISEGRSWLCDGYRLFFDHAAPAFDAMVRLVRLGHPPAAIMPLVARSDAAGARPGRNAPCPCGSGRKVKACCGQR